VTETIALDPGGMMMADLHLIRALGVIIRALGVTVALDDALVRLGHELGVQVTAEGIETAEELAVVRASGCSDGQGFLMGQPVAHPEFGEAAV
jgi:sensor c-di-GMP phosphodiesterase-like protein